jgi:hypothetical protein
LDLKSFTLNYLKKKKICNKYNTAPSWTKIKLKNFKNSLKIFDAFSSNQIHGQETMLNLAPSRFVNLSLSQLAIWSTKKYFDHWREAERGDGKEV